MMYNVQSVTMIVSPVTMLFGGYLAFMAHVAYRTTSDRPVAPGAEEAQNLPPGIQGVFQGIINGRRPSGHFRNPAGANANTPRENNNNNNNSLPGSRRVTGSFPGSSSARDIFERFQGQ